MINNAMTTQPKLFRCADVLSLSLLGSRSSQSFLFRVRLRRWLRGLRRAAFGCRGVGDDVEIEGHGFHGGSSFC